MSIFNDFNRKHANKEIDDKCVTAKSKGPRSRLAKKSSPSPRCPKGNNSIACDVCGQEFTNNTLVSKCMLFK